MNEYRGNIILVRGCPGSGKTSFCYDLAKVNDVKIAADDFFYDTDGNYNFDASQLHRAHKDCQLRCKEAMNNGFNIFVHNTFTRDSELAPYTKLAKEFNYKVYTIILENRINTKNQHGVPEPKLVEMERNLKNSIKLR